MPNQRGIFLEVTRRLAPSICDFTSEVFYDGRLGPRREALSVQRALREHTLRAAPPVRLSVLDVPHDRQSAIESPEEVERRSRRSSDVLLARGAKRVDRANTARR